MSGWKALSRVNTVDGAVADVWLIWLITLTFFRDLKCLRVCSSRSTHLLMLDQLFGVGALAHRGLPPLQGACAWIFPRTAPP